MLYNITNVKYNVVAWITRGTEYAPRVLLDVLATSSTQPDGLYLWHVHVGNTKQQGRHHG
jgi:hypothetical protein